MSPILDPVTLTGSLVRLELLSQAHHDDLVAATSDGELWRLWYTSAPSPENVQQEIARRQALHAAGSMLPFAVVDPTTNRAVGMTTYMNIDVPNRRVEIGSTWYAKSVQRTGLNTEAKLLLLAHAFDTLNCIAVEFRTHFLNQQSRKAIERLGARQDGILRNHSIAPNATLRDTVVYSIIVSEWPTIRTHLEWQLTKPR
jgi:RimJ/RimL family protein N-acetyltransferase